MKQTKLNYKRNKLNVFFLATFFSDWLWFKTPMTFDVYLFDSRWSRRELDGAYRKVFFLDGIRDRESFIGFRSRRVRLVCHPSEAPSFLAYSALMDDLETIPCGSSGTRVSHGRLVFRRKCGKDVRRERKEKENRESETGLASWI